MQYKYLRVVLKYSTRVDVVTDIIFRAPDFSFHKKRWLKTFFDPPEVSQKQKYSFVTMLLTSRVRLPPNFFTTKLCYHVKQQFNVQ